MKLKTFIICVMCLCSLIGCEQKPSTYNSRVELYNAKDTAEFSNWLTKANIKHVIDEQGVLWYNSNDAPKVFVLVELALSKGKIYANEILFGDVKYKQYFLEEMQKANINYSTEKRQNVEWIVWEKMKTKRSAKQSRSHGKNVWLIL